MNFDASFCLWCLPKSAHPSSKAEKTLAENLTDVALVQLRFLKQNSFGDKGLFPAYLSYRYRMCSWQPGHPRASSLREQMFHFLSSSSLLESLAEWWRCCSQRHQENSCSDPLHSCCTLEREKTLLLLFACGHFHTTSPTVPEVHGTPVPLGNRQDDHCEVIFSSIQQTDSSMRSVSTRLSTGHNKTALLLYSRWKQRMMFNIHIGHTHTYTYMNLKF